MKENLIAPLSVPDFTENSVCKICGCSNINSIFQGSGLRDFEGNFPQYARVIRECRCRYSWIEATKEGTILRKKIVASLGNPVFRVGDLVKYMEHEAIVQGHFLSTSAEKHTYRYIIEFNNTKRYITADNLQLI